MANLNLANSKYRGLHVNLLLYLLNYVGQISAKGNLAKWILSSVFERNKKMNFRKSQGGKISGSKMEIN